MCIFYVNILMASFGFISQNFIVTMESLIKAFKANTKIMTDSNYVQTLF